MKLRVYADPRHLVEDDFLCPLLVPRRAQFPCQVSFKDHLFDTRWDKLFELTAPEECDVFLFPATLSETNVNTAARLTAEAKAAGKKLLAFELRDAPLSLPAGSAMVFRTGLNRATRTTDDYPLPAFFSDRSPEDGAPLSVRARGLKPVVGFCGNMDAAVKLRFKIQRVLSRAVCWGLISRPRLERALRRTGLRLTRSDGKRVRYQALGTVKRCHSLQTNYVLRDHFFAGAHNQAKAHRESPIDKVQAEFCENILESHYTLCPRGGGNWSYRFYETLCLGRVPVYFDTGALLPYESLIRWKDYCVWVGGDRMEETPDRILRHYESHSSSSFRDLQRGCRKLWKRYLSLNGFFEHFYLHNCFDEFRD